MTINGAIIVNTQFFEQRSGVTIPFKCVSVRLIKLSIGGIIFSIFLLFSRKLV